MRVCESYSATDLQCQKQHAINEYGYLHTASYLDLNHVHAHKLPHQAKKVAGSLAKQPETTEEGKLNIGTQFLLVH